MFWICCLQVCLSNIKPHAALLEMHSYHTHVDKEFRLSIREYKSTLLQ